MLYEKKTIIFSPIKRNQRLPGYEEWMHHCTNVTELNDHHRHHVAHMAHHSPSHLLNMAL